MDRLTQMTVYVTVVDEGSFTSAATELGIAKSTVSRHVAALEDRLGVRLLNRNTRSLRPTDIGKAYYDRCARIVGDAAEADRSITDQGDVPLGTLRITAPKIFATQYVIGTVRRYMAQWPEVTVELSADDRLVDVVDDGYDVAIRIARPSDSGLVAKKLGESWHVLVASPDWLQKNKAPAHPAELENHALVTRIGGSETLSLHGPDGEVRFPRNGAFRTNDGHALITALLQGLGIGYAPDFMVRPYLQQGRLTRILPDWSDTGRPVYALYPHRRLLSPKVRVFLDMLSEDLGSPAPWECPSGECG